MAAPALWPGACGCDSARYADEAPATQMLACSMSGASRMSHGRGRMRLLSRHACRRDSSSEGPCLHAAARASAKRSGQRQKKQRAETEATRAPARYSTSRLSEREVFCERRWALSWLKRSADLPSLPACVVRTLHQRLALCVSMHL